MKQSKAPSLNPPPQNSKKSAAPAPSKTGKPAGKPNGSFKSKAKQLATPPVKINRPAPDQNDEELPEDSSGFWKWQMKLLGAAALVVLIGMAVIIFLPPEEKPDRRQMDQAMGTALAATGFTPPPSPPPGSEFGVSMVILNLKEFNPYLPEEKVNFIIVNYRLKSLFVSNCDGVLLQRFTGTSLKDKKQTDNLDNWDSIAPGGFQFCGPATGRQSKQIGPGVKADASFVFDRKKTRPFSGKSWEVAGDYRLLVQYYLLCPDNSDKIADCEDKHLAESDYFKIVPTPLDVLAVTAGITPPPTSAPTPTP